MRALAPYGLLFAVAATLSCRAKGSTLSDTLATSAESTSTGGAVAAPATTIVTPRNPGSSDNTGRGRATSTPKVDQVRTDSASAKTDSGIIGRDSIIRFPIRRLPTASSTARK